MSVGDAASKSELKNLLSEEAAQLRVFLGILEREQQVLVSGDVERLVPLAEEKSAQFSCLSELAEARNRALALQSLPPDRPGVEAWLNRNADLTSARKSWQELLDLTANARELNRLNGHLISTRLANNQQALATLLSAANQAALYGPDGQARPIGSGRSLGSV